METSALMISSHLPPNACFTAHSAFPKLTYIMTRPHLSGAVLRGLRGCLRLSSSFLSQIKLDVHLFSGDTPYLSQTESKKIKPLMGTTDKTIPSTQASLTPRVSIQQRISLNGLSVFRLLCPSMADTQRVQDLRAAY